MEKLNLQVESWYQGIPAGSHKITTVRVTSNSRNEGAKGFYVAEGGGIGYGRIVEIHQHSNPEEINLALGQMRYVKNDYCQNLVREHYSEISRAYKFFSKLKARQNVAKILAIGISIAVVGVVLVGLLS